ncbi:MAG: FAD-dependent oxidoreductase [Oscillibacter sp.]|jgi:hypothetical protein|nr:FAD-dependent oxidoreductase [Oscillibacter sp.]
MGIKNQAEFLCDRDYDVVVIGGGIAGVIAASAAARAGSRTLLVETSTFLGGVVTMGPLEALMTQYDASRQVIRGMAQELFDDLSALDRRIKNTDDTTGYCSKIIPYDAETMKFALENLLAKYHVTVLTEASLTSVKLKQRRIQTVKITTRAGAMSIHCRAVIDCSGSGYCAFLAGNDVMTGDQDGQTQPVTVLAKIGGVDCVKLRQYVQDHSEDFKTFGKEIDLKAQYLHLWGFSGLLQEGFSTGALSLQRNEIHMMETVRSGEVVVNYSRVTANPLDPFDMSEAQRTGVRQIYEFYEWIRRKIPAFKNSYIAHTGYVGVRESGRILGRKILTRDDVLNSGKCDSSVAMGSFPIDIHQSGNGMKFERVLQGYQIPAECLHAQKIDNLFMGGRCISSDFEANASCRISITCMATGHAAGVMAAVYAKDAENFSYDRVQKSLLQQNAILR